MSGYSLGFLQSLCPKQILILIKTWMACFPLGFVCAQASVLPKDGWWLWQSFVAVWVIRLAKVSVWFQSDLFTYSLDMPVIVPATTSPVKSTQQLIQNSVSPPSLSSMLDISLPAPSNRKFHSPNNCWYSPVCCCPLFLSPFPLPQSGMSTVTVTTVWLFPFVFTRVLVNKLHCERLVRYFVTILKPQWDSAWRL